MNKLEKGYSHENKTTAPTPNLEPNSCNEPLATQRLKRLATPCRVHIHSRRFQLADADGISGKAVIDGLVHARLLSDDSPSEIAEVTYSQEKVSRKKGETEETIITIEEIPK